MVAATVGLCLAIGTPALTSAARSATPTAPAAVLDAAVLEGAAPATPAGHGRDWQTTWAMAPSGVADNGCTDCTIRNVVHTTVGGSQVRVHLSNVLGSTPLTVGRATVALPAVPGTAQVAPGTMRTVRFGGHTEVTVPAGKSIVSDAVALKVPENNDLLVTTFTPGYSGPMTYHALAMQESFFTRGADRSTSTSAADLPEKTVNWHYVSGVDVRGSDARCTVVTFGDSITDGAHSTVNVDHRWPDFLAGRLRAERHPLAVANVGISGNRVLVDGSGQAGITRFQRDVLDRPGVCTVMFLLGINDIQQTPHQLDANKIIAGLRQMADRARAGGLTVIGGTLTGFEGWSNYDAETEATRLAVNDWVRTTRSYDSFVDFDAAIGDPDNAHRMLAIYDSGDHLHPNDLGYAAMADAVDLDRLGR